MLKEGISRLGEKVALGSSCRVRSERMSSAASTSGERGMPTSIRRHWPVWTSHIRIDLSLDPVATNAPADFTLESPAGAVCPTSHEHRHFCGGCESLTPTPASSRMAGYAMIGAKTAHSTTCSCPRNSIFVSPFVRSHIRDVCDTSVIEA